MSENQLKAFWEAIQADIELQQKLQGANDIDAVVEIAKAAGFSISADVLKKVEPKLLDEELEAAGGGMLFSCNIMQTYTDMETCA